MNFEYRPLPADDNEICNSGQLLCSLVEFSFGWIKKIILLIIDASRTISATGGKIGKAKSRELVCIIVEQVEHIATLVLSIIKCKNFSSFI